MVELGFFFFFFLSDGNGDMQIQHHLPLTFLRLQKLQSGIAQREALQAVKHQFIGVIQKVFAGHCRRAMCSLSVRVQVTYDSNETKEKGEKQTRRSLVCGVSTRKK